MGCGRFPPRIVNDQVLPGFLQIRGHLAAHRAQANETYLHISASDSWPER